MIVAMFSGNVAIADDNTQVANERVSLLDIWLAFPDVDTIAWPYSYIRAKTTDANQQARRQDLSRELDSLDWRLDNGRYKKYRAALAQWQTALDDMHTAREPGTWSPSWLLVHPNRNPPVSSLAVIGACEVPAWVEVWDSNGVERLAWKSGLMLSDVTRKPHPVDAGPSDQVAVVNPDGSVDRYGVAAWNFADTRLQPGARVVAALPLKGDGLLWIRDTIARVIAHSAPGVNCRELPIRGGAK
ncbi:hypothetical protein GCM10028792_30930 [Salinisphaera aquimarina]